MKFGSIIKTSIIDYPNRISTVLFTKRCNFKCPFCHNKELVNNTIKDIPKKEILNHLHNLSPLVDSIVISGGEPTLYKDLPKFLKDIKKLGLFIKLDTNGYNPKMLYKLIKENLIDYIAMDVKHDILDSEGYNKITGSNININLIIESIELIKKSNIDYQFRTTVIKGFHTIENIYNISLALLDSKLYVLQTFNPYNVLNIEWSKYQAFSFEELKQIAELIKFNVKKIEII